MYMAPSSSMSHRHQDGFGGNIGHKHQHVPTPHLRCSKTMDPDMALRKAGIIFRFLFHQEVFAWEQLKAKSFIVHKCHI